MNRRRFVKLSALAAGSILPAFAGPATAAAVPMGSAADAGFAPAPATGWRRFEVTTRLEPLRSRGVTRVWVPLPSLNQPGWQQLLGNEWRGNADEMQLRRDGSGAEMLYGEWAPDREAPHLEVSSRFATRDRAVDFDRPSETPLVLSPRQHAYYTRATQLLPTDGIVAATAREIVGGAGRDEDRARAIYEWIVGNTVREPGVRGCGTGDIRAMLETGNLKGKCADLNSLFVGLARAAGLPARDVYGLRVADSRFGYRSLGSSGDVSKAQHCRAEVHLERFGWVPVDPADVRKVVLEEPPGHREMSDPKVVAVRERLFGAWEMNWLAYNDAHDLVLPGSDGPPVPFLMYPQGEDDGGRFYSLDPGAFRYAITARELG